MKGKKKGTPSQSSNDELIDDAIGNNLAIFNTPDDEDDEEVEDLEENAAEEEDGAEDNNPAGEEPERPKLDEGYFEIEAIRRRRKRKGRLQYLIKWRGWPEASNTWEPLENLLACSDFIDAFEKSLHSGKSSRKRKRKHAVLHTQNKKKLPRSSIPPSGEDINGFFRNSTPQNTKDDDMPTKSSKYEYDPKLSELRVATVSEEEKLAQSEYLINGSAKSEPVISDRRTGSKRRKSFPVKRFQKDTSVDDPLTTQTPSLSASKALIHHPAEESKAGAVITKIVRPISFSASVVGDSQDVLVNFVATRADGKEAIVDNRFLKANFPLLLIEYYEQHLKYTI